METIKENPATISKGINNEMQIKDNQKVLEPELFNENSYQNKGLNSNQLIKTDHGNEKSYSASEVLEKSKIYVDYGLSVIPTNGDKIPTITWSGYQNKIMGKDEVIKYFSNAHSVAIICGKISGNLEVIDVDCKYDGTGNLAKDLFELLKDNVPDVFDKLVITQTKNKGWHIYYRCNQIEGNKKHANNNDNQVLIETRGEGGYVIAPPSPGYELKQGSFDSIPSITGEDRDVILNIAKSFDESQKENNYHINDDDNKIFGLSSFEDFNKRGDILRLLEKHGWTIVKQSGERIHFKRPGKTDSKVSGNWHTTKKIFYPFTSSTQFEGGKGYNATGVFTLLECYGDYSEAGRKLSEMGFGEKVSMQTSRQYPIQKIDMLPIEGFPQPIQNLINTCVNIYRSPRDYWSTDIIAATALAIGKNLELKTKYDNYPIFWICKVGYVSDGKTEPQKILIKPFKDKDNKSYKEYEKEKEKYEGIAEMTKMERETNGILEKPKIPQYFQYLTKDYTPETLYDIHKINNRGLLIDREEIKGWLDDFNRYNKSGEQSNMLSSFNGVSMVYNRKNSIIRIESPFINVLGGIQPDKLNDLAKDGRMESGFVQRFCFAFPDNPGIQYYNRESLPYKIYAEWENFIYDLLKLPPKQLKLTEDAHNLYEKWFNKNREIIYNEPDPYLKGAFGKLDIFSLRLTIVIKGMKLIYEGDYSETISAKIMQSALDITEYFRTTALKVYDKMFEGKKSTNKSEIIKWVLLNMKKTKTDIAHFFETSRSQLDRIEKKF
jgi:hypothetical protein